ncbi:MAG: polymer-forming cytoskeletal protein [Candidatus Buchananbacteria bacterium]
MKSLKKLFFCLVIGIFLTALPLTLWAADDGNVMVNAEQIVNGNFIKFGNVIEIKGAVNGDVIAAGNSIIISGPVAGDIIAVANSIVISGPVMGSIRVAGNSVEISNTVDHNVWAMANSLNLTKDSKIGWDANLSAGNINLDSVVAGKTWLSASKINFGGVAEKDFEATINSDGKIDLTGTAKIKGNLIYHAANDSQLSKQTGATVDGSVERKNLNQPTPNAIDKIFGPAFIFMRLVSLFSLLVVGLVLISLFPKMVLQAKEEMFKQPKQSIIRGLIWAIVPPVLCVILMITIIGFPLALILLPLYFILLYVSKVIVGFVIGLYLLDYFSPAKKYKGNLLWPMILGLALIVCIASLPIIGSLIKMVLVWWALGALISTQKNLLNDLK